MTLILLFVLLKCTVLATAADATSCPIVLDDSWIRIGMTRFFIRHYRDRNNFVDWNEALKVCESQNMKRARIDKLTTLAVVGRELEKIVRDKRLKDTWYWLDAKFDPSIENYVWQSAPGGELEYANYFYRQPRPTGVGAWRTFEDAYNPDKNLDHCLTLALPWPGAHEQTDGIVYGHTTSFDEKPCISKKKRYAICEMTSSNCTVTSDPFQLQEDKDAYFYNGNWIFGERKFIVNWKPRTINESSKYCQDLGLSLHSASTRNDICLVPFLKMWFRNITVSHSWTNWQYKMDSQEFLDKQGKVVANISARINYTGNVDTRSNKRDPYFCVSAMLMYEFKKQLPKCEVINSTTCGWNMLSFVPANCKNMLGTICQHQNHEQRSCPFKVSYIRNVTEGLVETATTSFGFEGNPIHRSTYKQTFGSLVCPPGSRMMRRNNTVWHKLTPTTNPTFKYDYMEAYWIVDDNFFNKSLNSTCTISEPQDRLKLKSVPCTDWHFYLCDVKPNHTLPFSGNVKIQRGKWDEQRQPRHYPLFSQNATALGVPGSDSCTGHTAVVVLDLVFVVDRSSKLVLEDLDRIIKITEKLALDYPGSQFGLTAFSDWPHCGAASLCKAPELTNLPCKRDEGKHHNDPEGCYTFYQKLTSDLNVLKNAIKSITFLSSGCGESTLTSLMYTVADKKLKWREKVSGLKTVLVLITDEIQNGPFPFPGSRVHPKGDGTDTCNTTYVPKLSFIGEIIKKYDARVFAILSIDIYGRNIFSIYDNHANNVNMNIRNRFSHADFTSGNEVFINKIKDLIHNDQPPLITCGDPTAYNTLGL